MITKDEISDIKSKVMMLTQAALLAQKADDDLSTAKRALESYLYDHMEKDPK